MALTYLIQFINSFGESNHFMIYVNTFVLRVFLFDLF